MECYNAFKDFFKNMRTNYVMDLSTELTVSCILVLRYKNAETKSQFTCTTQMIIEAVFKVFFSFTFDFHMNETEVVLYINYYIGIKIFNT